MVLSKAVFIKYLLAGLGASIFLCILYVFNMPAINNKKMLLNRKPPPEPHNPFLNIEKRIKQDKENIKALCENYFSSHRSSKSFQINYQPIQIQNYYMNEEKKLGWCFNAKSGSSTLKYILLEESGKLDNETLTMLQKPSQLWPLHVAHNNAFAIPKDMCNSSDPVLSLNLAQEKESIYSFSFVRHPYVRLVSAYEDKALGHSVTGEVFDSVKNKTFPLFIDHVLKEQTSGQAEHWRPQFLNCNYCNIDYDMIGRVETLNKDLKYISHIKILQFTASKNEKFKVNPTGDKIIKKHDTKSEQTNKQKITTEEKTIKYFSTLSETQLDKLYQLFRLDFEIFGYSVYPFVLNTNYNKI